MPELGAFLQAQYKTSVAPGVWAAVTAPLMAGEIS